MASAFLLPGLACEADCGCRCVQRWSEAIQAFSSTDARHVDNV